MVLPFSTTAPPSPPMSAPSSAVAPVEPASTMDLMSMLDGMIGSTPQPIYPPGYKPPKKPEVGDILSRAEMARNANQPYLDMIADTYRLIRMQQAGYWNDKDLEARRQNKQAPHISPRL